MFLALTKRLWIPTCFELYDIDIVEFSKSWAPPHTWYLKMYERVSKTVIYFLNTLRSYLCVSIWNTTN